VFILVEPQAAAGSGATRDGENALVCIGDGETYVIPVEVCETRYGVLVDQFALSIEEGGAGRFRGGRGLIRDYRITADEGYVTGTFGRFKYLPWGMKGGHQGSRNYMQMIHADGTSQIFGKTAQYRLKRGEVARLVTGTGGGYGDPYKRPEEDIVRDVRNGYITPDMAEKEYGLAVDPDTLAARNVRTRGAAVALPPSRLERSPAGDTRPGDRTEVVLSILRGETSVSVVALRLNVDRAEVQRWVDEFLSAGQRALGRTPEDTVNSTDDVAELRSMVRDLAEELSSLRSVLRERR
jgi:transposase-like protein